MDHKKVEKIIGVTFKDKALLVQAFTHRSYINESKNESLSHNERLEFLGDAVLELVITDFLYNKYPKRTEGDLTAFRAALVNTQTLSQVSSDLGLDAFLLLSKGEAKDTGRARSYILANTFEAVTGAIYLDQGYEPAKKFIADNLFGLMDDIIKNKTWLDAKSRFQERSQEIVSVTPVYKTIHEEGPDHDKDFVIGVFLKDEEIARGKGKSKQEAEQMAAREALEKKGWLD